ncbi:hypothetical protein GCM10020254_00910 [Streptomyces goshikiensis]
MATEASADDRYGGWVPSGIVDRVEGIAQGVGGLAWEVDDDEVDSLLPEQGGGRVPLVVEAGAAQPCPVEEASERLAGSSGPPVGV